ncbi:MAG: right-handed parallel beta-helix repeat-containing protein [Victivallales bacterium]|nr:right-handed parallel beta-helix repeat-containing protein [Victivallales bacterium]
MKRQLFMAALLSCLAIWAAVGRNQAKIDQVARGELKEARLSWWGFDEADSTAIIQEALVSKANTIIVDKMATPWVTKPVKLHSDMTLQFENGAEFLAKRGEYMGTNDSLITIEGQNNVTIVGIGEKGVLRMWKCDYQQAPYRKAEWRHTVRILSSDNVTVKNMLMTDSGGDGVYVSASNSSPEKHPRNIKILDCICDRHHRQGISIISVIGLLIENTRLTNTSGTAPMAGIDFEPNEPFEPMIDCVMRNCVVEGNQGAAVTFWTPRMDTPRVGKMSFLFENCVVNGGNREAFRFSSLNLYGETAPVAGDVVVKNCTITTDTSKGIDLNVHAGHQMNFTFENTTVKMNDSRGLPVILAIKASPTKGLGTTVTLNNLTVDQNLDLPWLGVNDLGCVGYENYHIKGTVTRNCAGKREDITVDKAFLKRYFPHRYYPDGPFCHKFDSQLKPAVAKVTALPDVKIRHNGTFWLYATKGEKVDLTLHYEQLIKNRGKAHPATLIYPSGKKVELGSVNFNTTKDFSFVAEEGGILKVEIFVENNTASIDKCSVPAGVYLPDNHEFNVIHTTGDFYFYLPAGLKSSCVRLQGDGTMEGVNAKVFDPAGNVVYKGEDICMFTEIPIDNSKPGVWLLKIMRPSTIRLEDLEIVLVQIPPYMANAPELVPVLQ